MSMYTRRLRNKRLIASLRPWYAAGTRHLTANCQMCNAPTERKADNGKRVVSDRGRQFRETLRAVGSWFRSAAGNDHATRHPEMFDDRQFSRMIKRHAAYGAGAR